MKIIIDESIILELSDLLTIVPFRKSKAYYDVFHCLKLLYDSIGYYTYGELEPKYVVFCATYTSISLIRLIEIEKTDEVEDLRYRIQELVTKVEGFMENTHGSFGHLGITPIPDFSEKDQREQKVKSLTWRFGCCLVIQIRAGGGRHHQLLQFMFEFFGHLNKAIYSSQGIKTIEENLHQFEEEFNRISDKVGLVKYPLDIIKNEFNLTIRELKNIFTHEI